MRPMCLNCQGRPKTSCKKLTAGLSKCQWCTFSGYNCNFPPSEADILTTNEDEDEDEKGSTRARNKPIAKRLKVIHEKSSAGIKSVRKSSGGDSKVSRSRKDPGHASARAAASTRPLMMKRRNAPCSAWLTTKRTSTMMAAACYHPVLSPDSVPPPPRTLTTQISSRAITGHQCRIMLARKTRLHELARHELSGCDEHPEGSGHS